MDRTNRQNMKAGRDKPPVEITLNVAGRECVAAIAMLLSEAHQNHISEDDGLRTETTVRKGGEPFSYRRDFSVATTYPKGVYLTLYIEDGGYMTEILDRYKRLFDSYVSDAFEDDDRECFKYEFRLTDDIENFEA